MRRSKPFVRTKAKRESPLSFQEGKLKMVPTPIYLSTLPFLEVRNIW
jgi:hypothetical protein